MKKLLLTAAASLMSIAAIAQVGYSTTFPKNGEVLEDLRSVRILFAAPASPNKECTENAVLLRNGEPYLEFSNSARNIQYPIDNEELNSLTFVFAFNKDQIITDWGEYEFRLPAGFLICKELPEGQNLTDPVSIHFTIPHLLDYTSDPRPGSLNTLKTITLTFPDAVSLVKNPLQVDEDGEGIVKFYAFNNGNNYNDQQDDPENPVSDDGIPESEVINGNTVTVTLKHTYTEPGTYTMVFPFGAYTGTNADGEEFESPNIALSYTILNYPLPELYPAPGEVFNDDLEVIKMTLPEGLTFSIWFPQMGISLYNLNSKGEIKDRVGTWLRDKEADFKGGREITLHGPEILNVPTGNYILRFSKSTFCVDATPESGYTGGWNQEFTYTYYIYNPASGIEEAPVEAAASEYEVYTLQGIRVAAAASDADIRNLPAGLYILRDNATGAVSKRLVK